jgi:predicted esterase
VFLLSGGLVGPVDRLERRTYDGSLDGTPVFLGCGDADEHVPVERVHRTAEAFRSIDGDVTERVYPGLGHEVTDDEFEAVGALLDDLLGSG